VVRRWTIEHALQAERSVPKQDVADDLIFAVSRSLKPEEQRHSAIERELLAVCL
jgi:hypothetical protein